MQKKLNYKNLTISGLPGAGSSTLGKALAKITSWKYFSGGDFMRNFAIKNNLLDPKNKQHHRATIYSDDFDRQVDYGMRKTLKEKSENILDSWLSGFMAQNIKTTLKILVFCSDTAIMVDRIANRDNLTIEEAKQHIFDREKKNTTKWKRLYKHDWKKWVVSNGTIKASKPIWFWYPELYDLTIDTYKNSKQETLDLALKKLGAQNLNLDYSSIFKSL